MALLGTRVATRAVLLEIITDVAVNYRASRGTAHGTASMSLIDGATGATVATVRRERSVLPAELTGNVHGALGR